MYYFDEYDVIRWCLLRKRKVDVEMLLKIAGAVGVDVGQVVNAAWELVDDKTFTYSIDGIFRKV